MNTSFDIALFGYWLIIVSPYVAVVLPVYNLVSSTYKRYCKLVEYL